MKTSKYTTLLDFLYDKHCVHKGIKNLPLFTDKAKMVNFRKSAKQAGRIVDTLVEHFGVKPSIVAGYHHEKQKWTKRSVFSIVPPIWAEWAEWANIVAQSTDVFKVMIGEDCITIIGSQHGT